MGSFDGVNVTIPCLGPSIGMFLWWGECCYPLSWSFSWNVPLMGWMLISLVLVLLPSSLFSPPLFSSAVLIVLLPSILIVLPSSLFFFSFLCFYVGCSSFLFLLPMLGSFGMLSWICCWIVCVQACIWNTWGGVVLGNKRAKIVGGYPDVRHPRETCEWSSPIKS
jgi:hypothetical protein